MSNNTFFFIYKCDECKYETNKKYNLIRHHKTKHNIYNNNNNKQFENINETDVIITNELDLISNEINIISNFICKKCNKIYKIKKSFLEHEANCNGLDDLTCHRCMISFTNRHNKSRHVAKNNCKPRSIKYARKPNIENINTQNNIETQNNYNIEIQNNTNNIYINNYGNERLDYLNYDKMLAIFKKAYDIPRLLTKEIHFNKEFPENNNIFYKNETKVLIKIDDEFILEDLNSLADELVNEKTYQIQKFALENKEDICSNIETQKYQEMVDLLLNFILLKEPQEHYKKQIKKIKDMIRNSNNPKYIK